jgi:hypothetical protein
MASQAHDLAKLEKKTPSRKERIPCNTNLIGNKETAERSSNDHNSWYDDANNEQLENRCFCYVSFSPREFDIRLIEAYCVQLQEKDKQPHYSNAMYNSV